MTDPLKAIQDTIGAQQKIYQAAYEAGWQAGMAKLDQAWVEIKALVSDGPTEQLYTQGYWHAAATALKIIEKLGGMNPQKRTKE